MISFGVASSGTPTTCVRGTITSLAVRWANVKRPWTISAGGELPPERASSLRMRSICSSDGGGGV